MKNTLKKFYILTLLGSVLLSISFISVQAYDCLEKTYAQNSNIKTEYLREIQEKSRYLATFEIVSLREESVKHYRLADGTCRAICYDCAIHKKDKNGNWQDSDDFIMLENGSLSTFCTEALFDDYVCNDLNVSTPFTNITSVSNPTDTNRSSSTLTDTYISSSTPNANYGSSSEIKVSSNSTNVGLIRIDEPSIPAECTIVDCYFSIPYYFPSNTTNYANVAAFQILSNWTESNVTMNSCPSISQQQSGNDCALGGATVSSPGRITLYVTDLAKQWYSGEANNYGIACKHIGGTESTVLFKSRESYSQCANLVINYSFSSLDASNGTYFVKNGHLGKYLQIDDGDSNNNYTSEGAQLELWNGTGANYQKWTIEYLHNGYYKIKSNQSNKVVSVESGYENVGAHVLIQETYNGSYRQQWSISITSHGMYKIKPRSSEYYSTDWVMCCAEGLSGNGRKVQQREYSNNSIYKDEWILQKLELNYVNFYDSTYVGETTLMGYMGTANAFANIVFTRLFDVKAVMDGSASQYTDAIADVCPHDANTPCSSVDCGSTCTSHHKNCLNISNQLYNQTLEDNHLYVLWSNRNIGTYCQQNSYGNHETVSWLAVVYGHRPIIHFLTVYGNNSNEKKAFMSLNIVHESAHTLGMDDVYYEPGHDVEDGYVCVMELFEVSYAYDFYDDILLGIRDPFCPSCLGTIEPLVYAEIMN